MKFIEEIKNILKLKKDCKKENFNEEVLPESYISEFKKEIVKSAKESETSTFTIDAIKILTDCGFTTNTVLLLNTAKDFFKEEGFHIVVVDRKWVMTPSYLLEKSNGFINRLNSNSSNVEAVLKEQADKLAINGVDSILERVKNALILVSSKSLSKHHDVNITEAIWKEIRDNSDITKMDGTVYLIRELRAKMKKNIYYELKAMGFSVEDLPRNLINHRFYTRISWG